MRKAKERFWKSGNARILIILGLVVLALAVRLACDSGPVYGIGDEGIYLSIFSSAVVYHGHPGSFATASMYRSVNFSNPHQYAFNANIIFKFYSGFIYPEILFLEAFGYTAGYAILYIILNSIVELVLVFLILELVSGRRAAVLGGLLLAFLPLDVMLSVRVLPVIPMVTLLTAAVYLFLLKAKAKGERRKWAYSFAIGLLIGLAYLIHPEGVILLPFLLLYSAIPAIRRRRGLAGELKAMGLMILGAFVAFSITGIPYLIGSGHFLLYPQVDHNVFLYQFLTEHQTQFHLGSAIFSYTNGGPLTYLYLLFRASPAQGLLATRFGLLYCSVLGYVLLLLIPAFGLRKLKRGRFFVYMLAFYLVCLSILPVSASLAGGQLVVVMVNNDVMYGSILMLPLIAITALELDYLLSRKSVPLNCVVGAILILFVLFSVLELGYDVHFYRSAMYDNNQLVGYIGTHPSGTFYANPLLAQNVGDITGYRYHVLALDVCNSSNIAALEGMNNSYFVLGGTISVAVPEGYERSYDGCVGSYLKNVTQVYNVSNPFDPSMPLQVFRANGTG